MDSASEFEQNLAAGNLVEKHIAKQFRWHGFGVEDYWAIKSLKGIGPRRSGHPLPDLRIYKGGDSRLVECKFKTVFTLHTNTGLWQMGINYSSWNHYLWVSNDMKLPLIILFAVSDKTPPVSGAPPVPRSGIWLQDSKFLCSAIKANLGHIWGPNDMIYWSVNLFRWWKRLPKELLDVYISNNQVYKKTEELGL